MTLNPPISPLSDFLKNNYLNQVFNYNQWVRACLYHPEYGYYTQFNKYRVGKSADTDFYTAETLSPIFGQLVVSAIHNLIKAPEDYTFIEIGVEKQVHVLQAITHPFKDVMAVGLGEHFAMPARAIVFMNELLDAQPFSRFRYQLGQWREVGVYIAQESFSETLLPYSENLDIIRSQLPQTAQEGYTVDISLEAESLLDSLVKGEWEGLIIICDYGKDWHSIIHETPQGTARGYYKHQQLSDLQKHPGEQDLTTHVCWDRLQSVLSKRGFHDIQLKTQERFFMEHALPEIEAIITRKNKEHNRDVGTLKELILPNHMGHCFQILTAHTKNARSPVNLL
jgi:SAM-dependent MidA family methyltransferase